ncbi:MAG: hypothetical protein CM15mV22_0320 [Eurybiavirus sp.]|nr:MAG: hypothetical protein CM15mV22_0320 [Eurybiavirus sp.]
MPLLIMLVDHSAIGVAIALYILRKYNPHNDETHTEVIDQIQEAMNHTKKNGDINWTDGDELDVCLAGTFAADRL